MLTECCISDTGVNKTLNLRPEAQIVKYLNFFIHKTLKAKKSSFETFFEYYDFTQKIVKIS